MSHDHKIKLGRDVQNELQGRTGDSIGVFKYLGKHWIHVKDQAGDDILRIYNITTKQMADLHAELGEHLRLAPTAAIEHLREMRDLLDKILGADSDEQRRLHEESMRRMFGENRG